MQTRLYLFATHQNLWFNSSSLSFQRNVEGGQGGGAEIYTFRQQGWPWANHFPGLGPDSDPICKTSNTPWVVKSGLIVGPEMDLGLLGPKVYTIRGGVEVGASKYKTKQTKNCEYKIKYKGG